MTNLLSENNADSILLQELNTEELYPVTPKETLSDVVKAFKELKASLSLDITPLNEITISDDKSFLSIQHKILSGDYVVVHFQEGFLKFITLKRECFIVDVSSVDARYFSLILSSSFPRKICINSSSIFDIGDCELSCLYDLVHITNIFYGYESRNTLKSIIKHYFKEPELSTPLNILLYNLFFVKDAVMPVILKYKFMNMINKEMVLLQILHNCSKVGLPFNLTEYTALKNNLDSKIAQLSENVSKAINEDVEPIISNKKALLVALGQNNLPTTLNKHLLKGTSASDLPELINCVALSEKYKSLEGFSYLNSRCFVSYNPYDEYGGISPSFILDSAYVKSSNPLVTGEYRDLRYRIFLNMVNNKTLIGIMNECAHSKDKDFIPTLSSHIYGDSDELHMFITELLLEGCMNGLTELSEFYAFAYKNYDTFINEGELSGFLDKFKELYSDLFIFVSSFNNEFSRNRRISLTSTNNVYRYIKLTESDIKKDVLNHLHSELEAFNSSNKHHIKFSGIVGEKFVLEPASETANIALDILNRTLVNVYESYIKRLTILCTVKSSKTL